MKAKEYVKVLLVQECPKQRDVLTHVLDHSKEQFRLRASKGNLSRGSYIALMKECDQYYRAICRGVVAAGYTIDEEAFKKVLEDNNVDIN